mgnify:CR=1 FL=1
MRMFKNFPQMLAFATSVLVSAVSAGFAQEGGSPLIVFADLDTDKDGALNASEALTHQGATFASKVGVYFVLESRFEQIA